MRKRTLLFALFLTARVHGQSPKADPFIYADPGHVPSQYREHVKALGDRLAKPGKERIIMTGVFNSLGADSHVRIIYELPAKLRFERNGQQARILGFDGSRSWASDSNLADQDQDMLESFV